jgi:hypothetical protein
MHSTSYRRAVLFMLCRAKSATRSTRSTFMLFMLFVLLHDVAAAVADIAAAMRGSNFEFCDSVIPEFRGLIF